MDNRLRRTLIIQSSRADQCGTAIFIAAAAAVAFSLMAASRALAAPVQGWLSWRGPEQTGVSRETGLPDMVSANDALWVADFPGLSAPVLANGRLYAMG